MASAGAAVSPVRVHDVHDAEIVVVVSDVSDDRLVGTVVGEDAGKLCSLVGDARVDRDIELSCAAEGCAASLAGQDDGGYSGGSQPDDAGAVAKGVALELLAPLGVVHARVGEDPVVVGDDEAYPPARPRDDLVLVHCPPGRAHRSRSFFMIASSLSNTRFLAVPERGFHEPDVADELLQPARPEGRGLVGSPHRPIEGDVALDDGSAERDGRHGRRDAALVARVADRDPVSVSKRRDHPQVQLLVLAQGRCCRPAGRRGDSRGSSGDGVVDLLERAHSRR